MYLTPLMQLADGAFPSYYYVLKSAVPGTSASVDFVMMDTVLLCGQGDDRLHGHLAEVQDKRGAEDQWAFIQDSLSKSK